MTQQILEKLESDVWLFYYFNLIGFVVTLWLEIIIYLSNRSFATASTSYKCKTSYMWHKYEIWIFFDRSTRSRWSKKFFLHMLKQSIMRFIVKPC